MTATLPPYPCLCSFASLSCVSSCSSAIGLAAGALQSLASSQRVGLTHYVKSFCPWGSQQWAMERWLSPVSTLALTDGYLSPLLLWWPKAPVCWCWVRRAAGQTKGTLLPSFLPNHYYLILSHYSWANPELIILDLTSQSESVSHTIGN